MSKLLAAAVMAAFGTCASAATVSIVTVPAPTQTVREILQFDVHGDAMGGMKVRATYAGGGVETGFWAPMGPSKGGVLGDGFSLTLDGDSFDTPWLLTNSSDAAIVRLDLLGRNVVVFDRTRPTPGTEGSAKGRDFGPFTASPGTPLSGAITATYSRGVTLPGDPFVGDVFRNLSIDFSALDDGGVLKKFAFRQDTDLAPIPVPAAGLLLLSAVGGLAWLGRRRAA